MHAPLPRKNGAPDGPIDAPKSAYQPDEATRAVTARVLGDYVFGRDEQNRPRREFNDRSLIQAIDDGHKLFNSYVPPASEDPDESWKAQTVRPLTRNKIISIASHVTSSILYPSVFAQDRSSREDRDAARVMRDLMEWTAETSNYARAFVRASIQALVEPVAILRSEYREVTREVRGPNGGSRREVDEELSGFDAEVVPCDELLVANFYEPPERIQRQRWLIRDRWVDHGEARAVWGASDNFKYVQPGTVCVFDAQTATFYSVPDDTARGRLVREVTYMSRHDDLEVVFVNGVLVTAPDRPNPRGDKRYPYAAAVYEPLGVGQFFYGKSAAEKLRSDQNVIDTLYNMVLDGTFLSLMPPMASYGHEDATASVFVPGTVNNFRDPNGRIDSLAPKSDIRGGLEAIGLVERSMSESSQDATQAGNAQGGERTAREILVLQQNAKIALGLFGKQIAALVEDFGKLRLAEIVQHLTVGQVESLSTGEAVGVTYRSFSMPDRVEKGARVNRRVVFTDQMLGSDEGKVDMDDMSFRLLDQEGGMDSSERVYYVNPEAFRKMKYRVIVGADELEPRSKALEKALRLEAFDRGIQIAQPWFDQQEFTREFLLETLAPGESSRFIQKVVPQAPVTGAEGAPAPAGRSTSYLSQLTGSNSLGVAASTDLGNTAQGTMQGGELTAG